MNETEAPLRWGLCRVWELASLFKTLRDGLYDGETIVGWA